MPLRYRAPFIRGTDGRPGIALLTVLSLLMVSLAFSAALVFSVTSGARHGNARERYNTASHLCQSALQMALKNIQANHGVLSPNPFLGTIPGHPKLAFRVEGDKNVGTTPRTSAFGGIMVPPGHIDLRATAIIDGQEVNADFGGARQLAAQAELKFERGVFETDSTFKFFSNTFRIDSYDETTPPFTAPMPAMPPPENCRASIRAASNLLLGTGLLCGDAYVHNPQPGVNYSPASPGPTVLTGSVQNTEDYVVPIRFQKPEEFRGITPVAAPATGSDLVILPGCYSDTSYFLVNKITLKSGLYYFESLSISGGTDVRLDLDYTLSGDADPVVVFVGSNLTVGASVNMDALPSAPRPPRAADLQVYLLDKPSTHEHGSVGMFSNARFRGVISSGRATMDLNGGAQLFGAFTVGDAWIDQDILIHQDTSLVTTEPSAEPMWVLYHELDTI